MKHVAPPARPARRGLGTVFAIPLVLLVASLAGLVIGLTGDAWHDLAAAALLSLPLVAVAAAWRRGGRSSSSSSPTDL